MARQLHEWDLSGLPPNAIVVSASLEFTVLAGDSALDGMTYLYPITFAFYRLLRVPDMVAATQQHFAGSQPWGVFGMQDAIDYRTPADATFQYTTTNATAASRGIAFFTVDVTSLAKFAAQSDERRLRYVLTRSDAHRRAFPLFRRNDSEFNSTFEKGFNLLIKDGNKPNNVYEPRLTIVYNDPLTIHPDNDDGTINEEIFIDSTANNIFVFDSIRIGGTGVAQKFWVKNRLPSSVANLKIFSQRSHGSKAHEMIRTGVGNGTIFAAGAEISTVDKSDDQVNYTRSERWQIRFTSSTAFQVYRDNGTLDDPTQVDLYSLDSPGSGTVASLYTSTPRGVAFLVTAGGTAFANGDIIEFRTFEDDAHENAPVDSDIFLQIAVDVANAPGTFRLLELKRVNVSAAVSNNTVVPLTDTTPFLSGTPIRFTDRTTGTTTDAIVQTVGPTSVTIDQNVTLAQYDYAEPIAVGIASLAASGTFPFWLQPVSPVATSRETKFPRWRAQAD
jgi:hypothetical protein